MKIPCYTIPVLKSYLRAFVAAVLAAWLAGEMDPKKLAFAGIAAVVAPIIKWLDPTDKTFGLGSGATE